MKNAFVFLLVAALTASAIGGTFTNESPADLQGMKVIWAVPTNVWPPSSKIWSYKVIPQNFSAVVVSNLMTLGSFTAKDKIKTPAYLSDVDKKAVFFGREGAKYLEIMPTLGYAEYHDNTAQARFTSSVKDVPEPIVGVPDETETTRLGLKYLRLAAIDDTQLAKKFGSLDLDIHWERGTREWIDQKTKKEITETNNFGVFFTRQINGIAVSGFGDFYVSFGNNAKVIRLQMSWRNLKPYQLLDNFVTPEQVMKSIQNGRTPLPWLEGWPLNEIKTLTITNATPRYGRKPGDKPMDFIVPALQLDAIIDNGKTNRSVWFQTSIATDRK
jgi:hypothetical protein